MNDAVWKGLWLAFDAQIQKLPAMTPDRLVLVTSADTSLTNALADAAARCTGADDAEWRSRLNAGQRKLIDGIHTLVDGSPLRIFRHLEIEHLEEEALGKRIEAEMPPANVQPLALAGILQKLAAEGGKKRERFQAQGLRSLLRERFDVAVGFAPQWKLEAYLASLQSLSINVPGTNTGGDACDAFLWPRAAFTDEAHSDFDEEQTLENLITAESSFDLQLFPSPRVRSLIVHAGPGFGKSALLSAIASRLSADRSYVPAIVPLSAFCDANTDLVSWLQVVLNGENRVEVDWLHLCESGEAALLLDGLDEVTTTRRAEVVRRIEQFSRRFPLTPWLLTVRDPAVVPAGFNAQKVEILPLDETQMAELVRTIRPSLAPETVQLLLDRFEAYPDLGRLVRIPLFLALVVATWTPSQVVPSSRSEVIELYLKTLFRPEEHKPISRAADPEVLRLATEALAYRLLEQGEIGAAEREVRAAFSACATDRVGADTLFDDALRCGILRRHSGGRLGFPFPIVQEYLAAQHLLKEGEEAILQRLDRAAQRPWAQSVQFAMEKLHDASRLAQIVLLGDDDVFATRLRLVARCVLHGMEVSDEIRQAIGDELANVWVGQTFQTQRRIGQMLRDGWAKPPSQALKKALHYRSLNYLGAGEILDDLAEPELTLSVLQHYLKRPKHMAHIGAMQPQITRLSARAFDLYIAAARASADEPNHWELGSLMSRLDGALIDENRLAEVVADKSLAADVRITAWALKRLRPMKRFWELAMPRLQADEPSAQWAAIRAMARTSMPRELLNELIRRDDFTERTRNNLIDHAVDVLGSREAQRDWLNDQILASDLDEDTRLRLRIEASGLNDAQAFESLLDDLPNLHFADVARIVRLVNMYPSVAVGEKIVAGLKTCSLDPDARARIISSLLMGATHKLGEVTYDSATLTPSRPHPSYDKFVALLGRWRDEGGFALPAQFSIEIDAVRAGLPGARDALLALAKETTRTCDISGFENPLNGSMRSALDELSRGRSPLDFHTTAFLVEHSDF
ncbi:MAG: NACHT domain-containing protein [Alphaproteobacteria bacterium]